MAEQDGREGEKDSATQAFADLQAEVTVTRRAVDGLPAAIKGVLKSMAPPDYAPSLGVFAKGLAGVEAKLARIEAHPTIRLTPEQHAQAIEQAGAASMRASAQRLFSQAEHMVRSAQQLEGLVGAALTKVEQQRRQWWFGAVGVVAGFMLFPLLGASLPGGSYLAAWAAGYGNNRWSAGIYLMGEGDPAGSSALASASKLVNANTEALRACSEAAAKAGKEQKCTVNVSVPAPAR
jgi:hypothetical protein